MSDGQDANVAFARAHARAIQSYLLMGLEQEGGRLPLFDSHGQTVKPTIIKWCREQGYIKPWFASPVRPEWTVWQLTERGRAHISMPVSVD